MRTDAIIDGQQVYCPNATTIGCYSRSTARVGDIVVYRESPGCYRTSRMIGRIKRAPALGSGEHRTPEIKGWLLVLALSETGHHAYERWINPVDVTEVREVPTTFAAWFWAPKLPYDADTLRKLGEYGTLSDHYIANADGHVRDWAARKDGAA